MTTTFNILIAALGGEGGGVLMNWLVEAARRSGHAVQATSVPGVAQRTGSTSYYIEILPAPPAGAPPPVFALVPMPGRVDVVVASEMVEAGRVMERGFVSPARTTLVTSTSRIYTTAEKVHGADGRFAPDKVPAASQQLAKRYLALDLDALAREHNTLVSATMFGALAATGVLPWPRAVSEAVIGDGRSAAATRAGFAAAFAAVDKSGSATVTTPDVKTAPTKPISNDARIAALPEPMREIARHGLDRVTEYQDAAYGTLYLERLTRLTSAATTRDADTSGALSEAARRLALWMAYEDVPRVAELKIKPERFARIRREAEMSDGQILHVVDYFKPGAEEVAAMLPKAWGERMMKRVARGGSFPFLGHGMHLKSTSLTGHTLMRFLASFKRSRRGSLRFAEEQAAIEVWLDAMAKALGRSAPFAAALAEMPRVLKGYSDTHVRGQANYKALMDNLVLPAVREGNEAATAAPLRKAITTALADPEKGHH